MKAGEAKLRESAEARFPPHPGLGGGSCAALAASRGSSGCGVRMGFKAKWFQFVHVWCRP